MKIFPVLHQPDKALDQSVRSEFLIVPLVPLVRQFNFTPLGQFKDMPMIHTYDLTTYLTLMLSFVRY